MNFLLAARRESATTTWKNGRLFAPPRCSLITTIWKDSANREKARIIRYKSEHWEASGGFDETRPAAPCPGARRLRARRRESGHGHPEIRRRVHRHHRRGEEHRDAGRGRAGHRG